jgi:hypothetical protein
MNMTRIVVGCWVLLAFATAAHAEVAVRTVALSGAPAPGTPAGSVFNGFTVPTMNNAGQVAFKGVLEPTAFPPIWSSGIWSEGSGSLTLLAADGMPAPGAPDGATYVTLYDPLINHQGQVAFGAELSIQTSDGFDVSGIWSQAKGDVGHVAISGQQAPGMPAGTTLSGVGAGDLRFNNAGQTAFTAVLDSQNGAASVGIWSEGSGSLTLVAQEGNPAAEVDGGNYRTLHGQMLNGSGEIAFSSLLDSPPIAISTLDSAAWVSTNGTLSLAARAGTPATEMSGGMVLSYPAITGFNNAGQFVLSARAFVTDAEGWFLSGSQGLWTNRSGQLSLLVEQGDTAPGTEGEKFARIGGGLINSHGADCLCLLAGIGDREF